MDYQNEVTAKMAAEQEYLAKAQGICGAQSNYGDTCGTASTWRSTMQEQAQMNAANHQREAEKHGRAAKFFRENPAFDDFIQLVRSGAIQF